VKNPKDSLLLFTLSNKTTVTVDLSIWPETNLTGKCFEEMRKLLPAGKYHYLLDKFYALKMTGNCADEWSVLTAAILALSDENDNFSSQPSVFAPIITALNSVLQFLEGQIVSYTDKVRIIGLLKHFDAAGCNFPPSRNRENLAVFVANNRHEKPSSM
jgi:hypothetical protein